MKVYINFLTLYLEYLMKTVVVFLLSLEKGYYIMPNSLTLVGAKTHVYNYITVATLSDQWQGSIVLCRPMRARVVRAGFVSSNQKAELCYERGRQTKIK